MLSHTAGVTVGGYESDPAGAKVPTLVQVHNGESPSKVAPVTVDLSRQLVVNAVVLIDFVGKYLATRQELFLSTCKLWGFLSQKVLDCADQIAKTDAEREEMEWPSFGCHTRNRLAAVATVNTEILVRRQDHRVGEGFTHAHEASISEAHGDVAVLRDKP